MQTLPAMIYLIPAILFFGTGSPGHRRHPDLALAPGVRMTAGIRQVDKELVEAARRSAPPPATPCCACSCRWRCPR
ncbi:hypothetical protein GCM10023238_10590 [Streptomyces heliomycini]